MKNKFAFTFAILLAFAFSGCPMPFKVPEPGPDYALVADHLIEGTGEFDYALVEMDGRPVERERIPFGVDMNARAVAKIGTHTFKVQLSPHRRPRGYVPHEATFTAKVDGGKTYFVGTTDGLPVLVEQR